jgi:hypothetical protein
VKKKKKKNHQIKTNSYFNLDVRVNTNKFSPTPQINHCYLLIIILFLIKKIIKSKQIKL